MNRTSNTIYEKTEVCLTCWTTQYGKNETNSPQLLSSKSKNYEKKISLKNVNQASNRKNWNKTFKQPSCIQTNSNTLTTQRYIQTKPTFIQSLSDQYFKTRKPITNPSTFVKPKNYEAETAHTIGHLRNKSALEPTSKILLETAKIQRILPMDSKQFQIARKSTPLSVKIDLQKLKASVLSFTEICDRSPRQQESQILEDYFHPTETRLTDIKNYIKSNEFLSSKLTH